MMVAISKFSSCLYKFRFEVLAIILVWIVFGGNLISEFINHDLFFLCSVLILITVSLVMVKNERKRIRFVYITFAILMLFNVLVTNLTGLRSSMKLTSLFIPLVFFVLLSLEVFKQMIREKAVTRNIIIAAFDCYLLLGILGATLFSILLYINPNAYSNVNETVKIFDKMLYFSFVTLTSIGYGDITPASPIAEKVTAFFGLIGHFYSVVVVGIIVGKYVAK